VPQSTVGNKIGSLISVARYPSLSTIYIVHDAKLQQIFGIHKEFSKKMQNYLYFVLQDLVIRTKKPPAKG
jgi:hypothetical protein